ncbi:MAG: hypothetical protein IAE81_18190 [Caldilineaceae bacterium]|jgi:hypothetical protein|nr:hypothetical protein [Caldilineaceae bacterium]
MNTRLQATFLCDIRLQARNGFYYAAAAVAVLTVVTLRLLPAQDLAWLLPVMIVNNLIVNGFYFLSGLVLLEKSEGSIEAQIVTPLRSGEYLAAKVGTLALLSLVENLLITLAVVGFNVQLALLAAGIVLGAALYALAGFVVVARYDAINTFLLPSVGYLLLLGLPLLTYFGIGQHPVVAMLLLAHPLQPILVLLSAAVEPASPALILYGLGAGAGWVAFFAWWADRSFRRFVVNKINAGELRPRQHNQRAGLHLDINSRFARRLGALRSLGPIDAHSIGRDALLRWMIFIPLVMALAIRWALPLLVVAAGQWLALDLTPFYAPLMGYMVLLIVPYFWGAIVGFLLLDQRDEQTLIALQVTPLSLRGYLAYRLLAPALLAALTTLLVMPITGLFDLPWWGYPLLALSVAPLAPLAALSLAALAQNKVQGLALMKAAGIVLVPPLIAYFLPAGWQIPLALTPTWWPAQTLWQLQRGAPEWWLLLIGGFFYQTMLLRWLVRRFDKTMHQ